MVLGILAKIKGHELLPDRGAKVIIFLVIQVSDIVKHSAFTNLHVKCNIYLQSFVGAFQMLEVFIAVRMMPLGECMTIIFSSPLFTAIAMRVCHGTRLRLWKSFFITSLLVGIILVMQPPIFFDHYEDNDTERDGKYYVGALLALACSVSSGITSVIVYGPLANVKGTVVVFYVGVASLALVFLCPFVDSNQRLFSASIGGHIFKYIIDFASNDIK